jgi:hypothetical protein
MHCRLLEVIFKCGGRQVDEVINQAQATKGALAAQRSAFMEIQGKLKQLADRFPVVRGLLGKLFGKNWHMLFLCCNPTKIWFMGS